MRANIAGMQRIDPRTYEAFKMMIDEMEDLFLQVNPLIATVGKPPAPTIPDKPLNFSYLLLPISVQFRWDQTPGAFVYEIRRGTTWESSTFVLRTPSLSANIAPLPSGPYSFLLKAISASGSYSTDPAILTFTITGPSSVSPVASVIDNNILLTWEPALSNFNIDYYIVDRGGTEIGRIYGTFAAVFEGVAGTYTYGVTAVDIAGNVGVRNTVDATVTAPSDYILEAAFKSDLGGTLVNVDKAVDDTALLACVLYETWEEHFASRGWNTILDQIAAGYPIYAQPMELEGSYEEVHDFGVILENTVISLTWSSQQIVPFIGVIAELSYSDDNITYSAVVTGNTTFAPSLRYVKFKLNFSTVDRRMMALYTNITIALSIKRDLDSGRANVFAANPTGTFIAFNKPFKDVESITVTPEGVTNRVATYDFQDVLNPDGFRVFLYDAGNGQRVDGIVSWKARGIL